MPPTTLVNRAAVARDARRAAGGAFASLARVRATPSAHISDDSCVPTSVHPRKREPGVRLGVAKLGHAWEAAHVRVFSGELELADALTSLCRAPGSEASSVIVQATLSPRCPRMPPSPPSPSICRPASAAQRRAS